MRTRFNSESAYNRAVRDLAARLARGGAAIAFEAAADLCIRLPAARDRPALLAEAGAIASALEGMGVKASRDLVLEGAAAFYGLRSWDALSAKLPRQPAGAVVEEAEDFLARLVRTGPHLLHEAGGGGRRMLLATSYYHPDDCRPEARRVIVELDLGGGPGYRVEVREGLGASAAVIDSRLAAEEPGSRKEADHAASELAGLHMFPCPTADAASRAEREAARKLRQAGFEVEGAGGGTSLWASKGKDNPGGTTFLISDEDGATHRFGDGVPVLLGIYPPGDGGDAVLADYPDLDAALAAVRAYQPPGAAPGRR